VSRVILIKLVVILFFSFAVNKTEEKKRTNMTEIEENCSVILIDCLANKYSNNDWFK